ncbi:MAG: hypothetical protein J3Q66DRAFT_415654 [Benniella sp.]|nr:MAG: hypothetical protein J3Q66DRAFT_415654 [Benniella sp.]
MGQDKWWDTIRGAGFQPLPYDLSQLQDAYIDVDLLSTFFTAINTKVLENKAKGKSAKDAGVALAYLLASLFPPAQTTLHVDGAVSVEKEKEHQIRRERLEMDLNTLEELVIFIEDRARDGKKISRAKWEAVEKKTRRVYRLSTHDKEELLEGLGLVFSVCKCRSEADLCISRAEDTVPQGYPSHVVRRIVVSNDSDMMSFGNISLILRELPHSRQLGLYTMGNVLTAFGFTTPLQLVALGCVSKNDFGKNVPGVSVKTNMKIIKGLELDSDMTLTMRSYCDVIKKQKGVIVDPRIFDTRVQIFSLKKDSVIDSLDDSTPLVIPATSSISAESTVEGSNATDIIQVQTALFDSSDLQLDLSDTSIYEGPSQRLGSLLARIHAVRLKRRSERKPRKSHYRNARRRRNKMVLPGKFYDISTTIAHDPPPPTTIIRRKPKIVKQTHQSRQASEQTHQSRQASEQTHQSGQASEQTRQPKKKNKTKKGLHNARENRKASSAPAVPRTEREKSNAHAKVLGRIYQTRTITIGSVEGNMKTRRLEMNRGAWREEDRDLFAITQGREVAGFTLTRQQAREELQSRFQHRQQTCWEEIRELSERLNNTALVVDELQRRAFWVAAVHIDSALKMPSSTDEEKMDKKKLLDSILDTQDFLVNASNMLFRGTSGAGDEHAPFRQAVDTFTELSGLAPVCNLIPGFDISSISRLSEMGMISVRASLKSHFRNVQFSESKTNDNESDIDYFFRMNEKEKMYKDFPVASFTPRAVIMSEEGLLHALWTKDTKTLLCEILGISQLTKKAAVDRVLTKKGILFQGLFSMGSYRNVRLQSEYEIPETQVSTEEDGTETEGQSMKLLRPSVVTNGHFVNLLVYETKHLRPRKSSQVGDGEEGEDEEDQEVLDILNSINEDLGVEAPFLPASEEGPSAIVESLETSTSTATSSSSSWSRPRGSVNWLQRSRDLENVGTVFANPGDCEPYAMGPRIGIDPGVTYPITATKLDPLNPDTRHTIRVSSTFLNEPSHHFQQKLQEQKQQQGISRSESRIPPFTRGTLVKYFAYLRSPQV